MTIKEDIHNKILADITSGHYKQNEIITEASLTAKYHVSKSPVREALIELCKEQILQSLPRLGYQVVPRILSVCHVLRYTPFYRTIKRLIDEGQIGQVASLCQIENVGYWHQAHSFVRGNWRSSKVSPMILQKSCHDIDILLWLAGQRCTQVASFGSLRHFDAAHAPAGAPGERAGQMRFCRAGKDVGR